MDTGSPVSFIDYETFFRKFPSTEIIRSYSKFTAVSGEPFFAKGKVSVCLEIEGRNCVQEVFLINSSITVILGLDSMCKLGMSLKCDLQGVNIELLPLDESLVASLKQEKLSDDEFLKLFTFSSDNDSNQLEALKKLLVRYKDIFSISQYDLGLTSLGYHDICTGNASPVFSKPYRQPHAQKKITEDLVNEMLSNGIIEEARSPWSSPFILVDKKDGTKRFVIDFRRLNDITIKDKFPMPNIDELIDKLSQSRCFSILDLSSGFWQVPLSEDSKQKTAFCALDQQFQFRVMPFGLSNAPATFQRLMQKAVKELPTTPYIDDLIVPTESIDDQITLLENFFDRLRSANFKLKPSKCFFMTPAVKYLGFIIRNGELHPDPEKLEAIRSFSLPQSTKDLQRFLGLCNFFSRFIPNFAEIAAPLTSIQNSPAKNFKKVWTQGSLQFESTFRKLQAALTSPEVLILPNFEKPFYLDVDASDVAIGGVLYQENGPVAYFSNKLLPAQRNYSTTDKEFLALYSSIMRFRPYLLGLHFVVFSDHKPFSSLVTGKPHNARQTRWQLTLQEFDFEIKYKSGKNNVAADALSRSFSNDDNDDFCAVAVPSTSLTDRIIEMQGKCSDIQSCVRFIENDEYLNLRSDLANSVRKCKDKGLDTFTCKHGLLYHTDRLVIPSSLIKEVILVYHKSGHFSGNKTQSSILERFWHPKLRKLISEVINNCDCTSKKSYGHNPMPSHFPPTQPFEVVSLDIVSLPVSRGHRYLLTMIDIATRWLVAVPLTNVSADSVASAFLRKWIHIFGPPAVIHTDQGTQFTGSLTQALLQKFNITPSYSSIYHPNGNSTIERSHRTLKDRLRVSSGQWYDNLSEAVYDTNRLSGAFQSVFKRAAIPSCDWPHPSDFINRPTPKSGPQVGDTVSIRDHNPKILCRHVFLVVSSFLKDMETLLFYVMVVK